MEPKLTIRHYHFGMHFMTCDNRLATRERGPVIIHNIGTVHFSLTDRNCQYPKGCGPSSVRSSGEVEYKINGRLHRLDGPARIYANGRKAYYVDGIEILAEEFFLKYGVL